MSKARTLSQALQAQAEAVCNYLLPNGIKRGAEWCVGDLDGQPGQSLRVNLNTGRWADFATGQTGGDLLDLWAAVQGCTLSEAMGEASRWLGQPELHQELKKETTMNQPKPLTLPGVPIETRPPDCPVRAYLTHKRGLTLDTLARYGVHVNNHAYVLPTYSVEGRLERWKAITPVADGGKQVYASPGPAHRLFGWQAVTPDAVSIFIVEGELDAITLAQWGYAALSVPAGTASHGWATYEALSLRHFKRVYLLFDNDAPGQAGCQKAMETLQAVGIESVAVSLPPNVKDANAWLLSGATRDDMEALLTKTQQSQNRGLLDQLGVYDAAALPDMEIDPLRWLVPDLLPAEGLMVLAAPPKTGKSALALQLALALSMGGYFLDKRLEQAGVLYLGLEDSPRRMRDRLQAMGVDASRLQKLQIAHQWKMLNDGALEDLSTYLELMPATKLVVIDTLGRLKPPHKKQGDVYGDDVRLFAELQRLAINKGIAILLVHHTRKAPDADELAQVSGSWGLIGTADAAWLLKRARTEKTGKLLAVGRDFEEQSLHVRFEQLRWWPVDAMEVLSESQPERAAILEYLEAQPQPMTPTQLAEAMEMRAGTIKPMLRRMLKDGLLEQPEPGKYGVACKTVQPMQPLQPGSCDVDIERVTPVAPPCNPLQPEADLGCTVAPVVGVVPVAHDSQLGYQQTE